MYHATSRSRFLLGCIISAALAVASVSAQAAGDSTSAAVTTVELPALETAGAVLESKVKTGLADCPIARYRRFRNNVKSWDLAATAASQGDASVTWLPFDIVRSFTAELKRKIISLPGSNSRALFYFAVPTEEHFELDKVGRTLAIDPDIDANLKFFFANRGNPNHQLISIPGALTGAEDQFLYGNIGRMVYKSSCLTSMQAALQSQLSLPILQVAQTLDAAGRNSRSTLILYGAFQSPLWFMLSGNRGFVDEQEALIGIWNLYANDPAHTRRSYVSNFVGWLLLHVQGRELSGSATVKGSSGASLGVASIKGSSGIEFQSDEALTIESYELLIEPDTLKFDPLPAPSEVRDRWKAQKYSSSNIRVALDAHRGAKDMLKLGDMSSALCNRLGSSSSWAEAVDKKENSLGWPELRVETPVMVNDKCQIGFEVDKIPDNATRVYLSFPVSRPLPKDRIEEGRNAVPDTSHDTVTLLHVATVTW